ncbi:hypothetical protein ATCC90586_006382 [Pythium insidiosum]|nr:hypothetical protein ATCC90586_006382 [Pythium insidiosum]
MPRGLHQLRLHVDGAMRRSLRPPSSSAASWRSLSSQSAFTHVDADGRQPKMVDVGAKAVTRRSATARTTIRLPPTVLRELQRHGGSELAGPKGPIGATAIIAGVLGAKQTSSLIPFCHPLPLEDVQVRITTPREDQIAIECEVRVTHKTGVEMEALTGASVAALCVYDMCKALSHDIVIEETRLVSKRGGKRDVGPD